MPLVNISQNRQTNLLKRHLNNSIKQHHFSLHFELDACLTAFVAQLCAAQLCVIGLTTPINLNWKFNEKQFIMQYSWPVTKGNLLTTAVLYLILLGNILLAL